MPPPTPLACSQSWKPKRPKSDLDAAAKIIQSCFRNKMKRRRHEAFLSGEMKIFQQKHTVYALDTYATLIAKVYRGKQARQETVQKPVRILTWP